MKTKRFLIPIALILVMAFVFAACGKTDILSFERVMNSYTSSGARSSKLEGSAEFRITAGYENTGKGQKDYTSYALKFSLDRAFDGKEIYSKLGIKTDRQRCEPLIEMINLNFADYMQVDFNAQMKSQGGDLHYAATASARSSINQLGEYLNRSIDGTMAGILPRMRDAFISEEFITLLYDMGLNDVLGGFFSDFGWESLMAVNYFDLFLLEEGKISAKYIKGRGVPAFKRISGGGYNAVYNLDIDKVNAEIQNKIKSSTGDAVYQKAKGIIEKNKLSRLEYVINVDKNGKLIKTNFAGTANAAVNMTEIADFLDKLYIDDLLIEEEDKLDILEGIKDFFPGFERDMPIGRIEFDLPALPREAKNIIDAAFNTIMAIGLPDFGATYAIADLLSGKEHNRTGQNGLEDLIKGILYNDNRLMPFNAKVCPKDIGYNGRGYLFTGRLEIGFTETYSYGNVDLEKYVL